MRAGGLRHRITLEKPVRILDELNQPVISWAFVAEVWADIQSISGRERLSASAEQSELSVRIWIRYRDDIRADWRVINNGLVYMLGAPPLPDAKRTRLELLCSEGLENA